MKRLRFFVLSLLILPLLTLADLYSLSKVHSLLQTESVEAQGGECPNGVCHLVYDPIDDFWYCVGSAMNCCCDFPKLP